MGIYHGAENELYAGGWVIAQGGAISQPLLRIVLSSGVIYQTLIVQYQQVTRAFKRTKDFDRHQGSLSNPILLLLSWPVPLRSSSFTTIFPGNRLAHSAFLTPATSVVRPPLHRWCNAPDGQRQHQCFWIFSWCCSHLPRVCPGSPSLMPAIFVYSGAFCRAVGEPSLEGDQSVGKVDIVAPWSMSNPYHQIAGRLAQAVLLNSRQRQTVQESSFVLLRRLHTRVIYGLLDTPCEFTTNTPFYGGEGYSRRCHACNHTNCVAHGIPP